MSGVQCLKRLYWQVHAPELGGVPDAAAVAIMEQGGAVGRLARQLFAAAWKSVLAIPSRRSERHAS